MSISSSYEQKSQAVSRFIADHMDQISNKHFPVTTLVDSMNYSLQGGGKRFRPVLTLMVGDLLEVPQVNLLPFAAAVEMIHTYSLIHDDLPALDNDDLRRGRKTNHVVFGEATALLAGDALLTEAFSLLAQYYANDAFVASSLIRALGHASGLHGMIGGQIMDMAVGPHFTPNLDQLTAIHELKTGKLIEVCAVGASVLAKINETQKQSLSRFAFKLGLSFQVADDILDAHEEKEKNKSFVGFLGLEKTREFLRHLQQEMIQELEHHWSHAPEFARQQLVGLANFNIEREK